MSALLFNIVIDWVLSRTTEDRRRGIRWTLSTVLEDLDYADDITLLSHSFNDMQEKSVRLNRFARQVGLTISPNKTEVLPVNISLKNIKAWFLAYKHKTFGGFVYLLKVKT